jgi:[glutamine synthetase] adenylyltransferase / [glutamine synthetase]-adenylyl-L-tyrosine phosphorylase
VDALTQLPEYVEFRYRGRAAKNIETLRSVLPSGGGAKLSRFLRQMPDPDAALNYLQRYLVEAGHPTESIFRPSRRLHAVLALFSHSHFLSDAVVRHPELIDWALDEERFYRVLSNEEMYSALGWSPAVAEDPQMALVLARFKRMHLIRIALRDLLGTATLAEVTLELSNLADAILHGAHEYLRRQLIQKFGRPLSEADAGTIECQFAVLGLGKLGGRELNYSSDIDLMYIYTRDGMTSGPVRISNKEFILELATRLTQLLSMMTAEGSCYRVDLRLRPDGSMGELVIPLQAALDYYHRRARDWELQMLIKARPTAGAIALGHGFLKIVEPLIYQTTTDFSNVERVAETRDRIQQKLRRRSKPGINVKLARGGIRDIEFLVQCFQRLYGGRESWVRSGSTLFALHRLRDKGYLSLQDYGRLDSAYQFLRTIEHLLQIEDDRQVHTLPSDAKALDLLMRKVRAKLLTRAGSETLPEQVERHLRDVGEIYDRIIHAQQPVAIVPSEEAPGQPLAALLPRISNDSVAVEDLEHNWRTQLRHLERESPALAQAVQALPRRRGHKHFELFLNKIVPQPRLLREFERLPALVECAADLIEHSPYLAENLIRYPEDVLDLRELVQSAEPNGPEPDGFGAAARPEMPAEMRQTIEAGGFEECSTWLRRFYRRSMLRLQAESVFLRRPIFATLARTSDLADHIIQAAYEIALKAQCDATGRPRPPHALRVIALGRLGMREFDLASDADLVFVLRDDAAADKTWWTDVVNRAIETISSYTVEGLIFSVDPRLRPMGRDGELVQTESAYKSYFAEHAQAWEAITYMKSRAVAGDREGGTAFLTELQDVDWRRYGMSGDLGRLLLDMRNRLEREQGKQHPIKAGAGGYYDLDFILMYLRLRDAGIFFESLTTPERIEVIRSTHRLTGKQARTLQETAVFFRALDHAIRVSTGHSSSKIPSSLSMQEILAELIGRWSKLKPAAQPLPSFVQQVRQATRTLFLQVFEITASGA